MACRQHRTNPIHRSSLLLMNSISYKKAPTARSHRHFLASGSPAEGWDTCVAYSHIQQVQRHWNCGPRWSGPGLPCVKGFSHAIDHLAILRGEFLSSKRFCTCGGIKTSDAVAAISHAQAAFLHKKTVPPSCTSEFCFPATDCLIGREYV